MSHITKHKVRMYDTDTAQILFFGNQFRFVNDAFEEFLLSIGYNMAHLFHSDQFSYGFVVVHAESDYLAPVEVGSELEITTMVDSIGDSSFVMAYEITKKGKPVGKAKTVHVVVDKSLRKKIPVPNELRQALTS